MFWTFLFFVYVDLLSLYWIAFLFLYHIFTSSQTPSTTTGIKHERWQTAQEFNGLKLKIKQSRIYLFILAFQPVKLQRFPAVLPVAPHVNYSSGLFNRQPYIIQRLEDVIKVRDSTFHHAFTVIYVAFVHSVPMHFYSQVIYFNMMPSDLILTPLKYQPINAFLLTVWTIDRLLHVPFMQVRIMISKC